MSPSLLSVSPGSYYRTDQVLPIEQNVVPTVGTTKSL
jgi:hypothetical protein